MNRSLIILTMGIAGVVLGTAGLVRYINMNPPYEEMILSSDEERRNFLLEYGCSTKNEPPAKLEITLPASGDSSVFGAYCVIQSQQQLPLSEYFGEKTVMWTYILDSSPTERAELICTEDGLLLGAMHYDCRSFDHMYPIIT